MQNTIAIRFLRSHGVYNKDVVASFPPAMATHLVSVGAAELYEKPEQPAAKQVQHKPLPRRSAKSVTTK